MQKGMANLIYAYEDFIGLRPKYPIRISSVRWKVY